MKTKINYLFILLLASGCQINKIEEQVADLPIPPPPPNVLPSLPPPNFIPDINNIKEIQVNRLPHPFNVNGTLPYAVWVDGERLALNSHEIKSLATALNLKFTQPKDTAEIHSGEGWLFPKKINKTKNSPFAPNNLVENEEEEKFNSPEVFIDN